MMQWLQLHWQQLLIGFGAGAVLAALLAWLLFYLQQKKMAAECR